MTAHEDPFSLPLNAQEVGEQHTPDPDPFEGAVCVSPCPSGAPEPAMRHKEYGEPSDKFTYRDADKNVLGYVARFDTPSGKQILPYTVWKMSDGKLRWRWKQWTDPRPLLNLHGLAQRPDATVLVVEGEKAAREAHRLFPDYVVTTSSGGSKAASKADWSPVADRDIVIWPDADKPGAAYADDVARLALEARATSVRVVDVSSLPDAWDVADPVPSGVDLRSLLDRAAPWQGPPAPQQPTTSSVGHTKTVTWPPGFVMNGDGLFLIDRNGKDLHLISGPFKVTGEARDNDNDSWSIALEWQDPDGVLHHTTIARADLIGDGVDCLRPLASGGLKLASGRNATGHLKAALAGLRCLTRERHVFKTGWKDRVFVLPNKTIGLTQEPVVFKGQATSAYYAEAQTFEEWKSKIAAPCVGNTRLLLAVSVAFSGPVIDLLQEEPGGVHLVGKSSCGKSSTLFVAGSVWGGGGRGGFTQTWRATGNGLEGVAKAHSGTALIIDELGELDPRDAGAVAYSLINGQGKARASRDGSAVKRAEWRCQILSSGEVSLADKIEEAGRKAKQGQLVRLVNVPADAGKGLGMFANTHSMSPETFSDMLKREALSCYGTAGPAFVEYLASDNEHSREYIRKAVQAAVDQWSVSAADGQVARVAKRFALIGASGELARVALSLPWAVGEAMDAARVCFEAWREQRGGDGAGEVRAALEAIREAVEKHGDSRFIKLEPTGVRRPTSNVVRDALGYWFEEKDESVWGFSPSGWKEALKGIANPNDIAKELAKSGYLIVTPSNASRNQLSKRIDGATHRLYAVKQTALESGP
jgi:putative DNA primase/helicase